MNTSDSTDPVEVTEPAVTPSTEPVSHSDEATRALERAAMAQAGAPEGDSDAATWAPGAKWDVEPIVDALDVVAPTVPTTDVAVGSQPASVVVDTQMSGVTAPPSAPTGEAEQTPDAHVTEAVAIANDSRSHLDPLPTPPASTSTGSGQGAYRLPPVTSLTETLTLKNARVGVPYEASLAIEDLTDLHIRQPVTDMGLHVDRARLVLDGTPNVPGDFEWVVSGRRRGAPVALTVRLAVIPDPRSLWKDLPSDSSADFWKPDVSQSRLYGEVYVIAASKRGRSHAHDGRFRDDDFAMTTSGPGGWHVVAVADGAGSAQFSREGSKIAVNHVVRTLPGAMATTVTPHLDTIVSQHQLDPEGSSHSIRTVLYQALVSVAFSAAKEVEDYARAASHEPADFSTTLIMGAVTRAEHGWFVACFSIGDGGAALLDVNEGTVTVMTTPDGGEFAGQTRFLRTSEFGDPAKSMERIHYALRPSFTSLSLMTDGITDPKFPTEVTFADYERWKDFWVNDLTQSVTFTRENSRAGEELLAWMDFWSDGNHDDRTLAVLLP